MCVVDERAGEAVAMFNMLKKLVVFGIELSCWTVAVEL